MMRRIISSLLVVMTLLSLFGCGKKESGGRKYDESVVLENADALITSAEVLNLIYYGSGIKYYNDENTGYYCKADYDHLAELGFSTIDELKALTEKTFSDRYSLQVYSTILSPLSNDTSVVSPARYYQAYDEETGEATNVMVYSNFTPLLKSEVIYDYGSLKVEGSKGDKVYVTVEATVKNAEGKTQNTTLKIALVEEHDGWRIDSPTFENYKELKDKYDELKDLDIK